MLRTCYFLAAGLVAMALFVSPAAAQEGQRQGTGSAASENVSSPRASASSDASAAWTKERMAAAVEAGPSEPTYGVTTSGPTRRPTAGPVGSVEGVSAPTPRVLDAQSMTGRVFFVDDRGEDHSCSGSTVNSGNRRLVFTTGACVHGGGEGRDWYDVNQWIFVPAYHAGAPYGQWNADEFWTKTGWIEDGDRAYDVAAVLMEPKDGVPIVDAVGGHGIRWDIGYELDISTFGYPDLPPYDGSELRSCSGTTRDEDGFATLDCSMTGGAGGGPWLYDYDPDGWSYLNGVNSWLFWNDDPSQVYKWQSPYFSYDLAGSLYEEVGDL